MARHSGLAVALAWGAGFSLMAQVAGGDHFETREPITFDGVVSANLAMATSDPAAPQGFTMTLGRTRWWSIRAPHSGRLVIRIDRSSALVPSLLAFGKNETGMFAVRTSNSLVEPCHVFYAPRRHWDFAVDAVADEEIVLGADIAVDSLLPSLLGPDGTIIVDYSGPTTFRYTVQFVPSPANDAFANAHSLESGFISIDADVFGASVESGEPRIPGSLGRTVWYEWTAPANGQLSIGPSKRRTYLPTTASPLAPSWNITPSLVPVWSLLAQPYWLPVGYGGGGILGSVGSVNTINPGGGGGIVSPPAIDCRPIPSSLTIQAVPLVGVYTGESPNGLSVIAQGKDISFIAGAGTTYRIAIDASEGDLGRIHLDAQFTAAPENDLLAHAARLEGTTATATGHSIGTTREAFEGAGPSGVWWMWSPNSEGPVQLSAKSPDAANVQLDIRVVGPDGALQRVATVPNSVNFYAARGGNYLIGVAPEEAQGDYTLSLSQLPSRLRPVIIHPESPESGLLIAETGWTHALLQQSAGVQWVDRGIVVPQPVTSARRVAGYYLPIEIPQLDPSAAGLYRVWLIDFELPPAALNLAGAPFPFESGSLVPIDLVASPGRQFDLESTDNLNEWTTALRSQWSSGFSRIHVPIPIDQPQLFFRVREVKRTALPLMIGE
jgi:hypothetical protein